jgi:ABC-type multidrug transport system fused ATPase/permease subunit
MTTSIPDATRGMTDPSDVGNRSFAELVTNVTDDLSTLMRQEIELAKAELRQEASKAGQAGGMFAGAGVAALMILIFLSVALWWGLSNVMDGSWAALIVALIWAAVAAVLVVVARGRLRQLRGLPRTTETAKEIPAAVKPNPGDYR